MRWKAACGVVVTLVPWAILPGSVAAQEAATAPESFSVDIAATPLLIEISAPAALPLDVSVGLAYSQVGVNSQPRIQSTAGPAFVPLLSDVGLLGGPSGVLATVVRLAPGLVVGLPTLFGLDPIPVDTSVVDVGPLAGLVNGLPIPALPALGCTSYFPDVPRQAECGGPVQDFFGFQIGAGSARTVSDGEEGNPATLSSRSDAALVGVTPSAGNSLAPFSAGVVASTAESKIIDGRVTATAAAEVGEISVAGALTISGVKSSYAAALGGTKDTFEQTPLRCEIGAVHLAGQRISLGEDGITLGSSTSPLPLDPLLGGLGAILGTLGGQVGPIDFGSVTVTPNPRPTSEVSEDGTLVSHRFGCLEVRYRNVTSGTDVRLTVGNLAVTMNAFGATPLAPDGTGPTLDGGPPIDLGDASSLPDLGGDLALPDIPEAGSSAPPASDQAFVETSGTIAPIGWGIDGGWFAPFGVLAISLPVLARARRFAPTVFRSPHRR